MNKWLLLFTIGPVQSFIGNSRKMRDLYAGSFLLSHLILRTCHEVQALKTDIQIEKIIPIETPSVPNRILLKVTFPEEENRKGEEFMCHWMDDLAQKMGKSVRDEFQHICKSVFEQCVIKADANMWTQLENFPEVYWVYQKCESSPSAFEEISGKLQSVKSLRVFRQCDEKAWRKCSLFPEYNALFYRSKDENEPRYIDPDAVEFTGEGVRAYALKPGEGLSALAFVKRMLYCISDDVFPGYNKNIISVASMLLNDRFEHDPAGQALLKRLSPEAAEAVFDRQNGSNLSQLEYKQRDRDAAEALFKYMQEKDLSVSPYYAVVKFDGDGMGTLYQECPAEKQTLLSKEIGEFAKTVPGIISNHGGMCIYAGGEDFLGFFPAAKAIPALLELRREFQNTVKHPLDSTKKLTFSAGIVFAHLMPPLKDVLVLADEMERRAKSNPDKDSFAIAVSKRSGKRTEIRNRFGNDGANLKALFEVAQSIQKDVLSKSGVYTLISMLSEISVQDAKGVDGMVEPLILQSICSLGNPTTTDRQNANNLIGLYHQYGDIPPFVAALEIAVFLGKGDMSCITE